MGTCDAGPTAPTSRGLIHGGSGIKYSFSNPCSLPLECSIPLADILSAISRVRDDVFWYVDLAAEASGVIEFTDAAEEMACCRDNVAHVVQSAYNWI